MDFPTTRLRIPLSSLACSRILIILTCQRLSLCKVEYHENHARWFYLTTVLNMGKVGSIREGVFLDVDRGHCEIISKIVLR